MKIVGIGGEVEMLHITICDDEAEIVSIMEDIIVRALEELHIDAVIAKYQSGEAFLQQHRSWDEELIFMDIEMPVKSGIDVIEEMDTVNRTKNVILITAYDHMVLKHLNCAPFLFIRKENMETDIPRAIDRYVRQLKRNREIVEFVVNGKVYQVKEEEILYFEKYRQYITAIRTKDEAIRIRGSMQDYENRLSGKGFVRSHVGYLVNLRHCCSIEKDCLVLDNGKKIPISRERKKYVMQQFMLNRR